MSDHTPMRGGDRVRDTLTALRRDTDRVALPDAADVRRRGQARTRHQAMAGAAAAVLLVAGVVSGAATLAGNGNSRSGPPATKAPTPAPTTVLPERYLLTTADLPAAADGFPDYAVADRQATVDDAAQASCLPGLRVAGAVAQRAATFTAMAEWGVRETSVNAVYRLPSPQDAAQAERDVLAFLADCPARLDDSTTVDRSALGDGTYLAHTLSRPQVQFAVPHEALLVVRSGDLVSVTSYMRISQDADYPQMLQPIIDAMGRHIGRTATVAQEPVLLQPADLPVTSGDQPWQPDPSGDAGLFTTDTCLPAYDGAQFVTTKQARFVSTDPASPQAAVQWVYVTADAAGAGSTFTDAVDWISACPRRSHPELSGPVTRDERLVGTQGGVSRVFLQMTVGDVHQRIAVGQVGRVVTVLVMQRTSTAPADQSQQEFALEKALSLLQPFATG